MNELSTPTTPDSSDQAATALKTTVVDGAHDISDGVKHLAEAVIGQTRKSAESQVASGKERAAESLKGVASALRKTGEQPRHEVEVTDDGASHDGRTPVTSSGSVRVRM